jgi:hypothetical protein
MGDEHDERKEFEAIVAEYRECGGVKEGGGGCACMGGCLGNKLAQLRKKYDHNYAGTHAWWSDQLHGKLLVRPGDSGRHGAPLNAESYWTGTE